MDNKEVYKRTLTFSIRRLLWNTGSFIVIILLMAAGAIIGDKISHEYYGGALVGFTIGMVVGTLTVGIISHFISYIFKAGQIAMMTVAISEGKLPENVYAEGKKLVKERFTTVGAYYLITNAIKAIFAEIGRAITSVGRIIGGKNGGAIGSAISATVSIIISYLCDCCLGWVFYHKDKSATKATLEGAVLFFKHGKTFVKNMGRVFGMGALSFLVIGGTLFGLFYLIASFFPDVFNKIASDAAVGRTTSEEGVALQAFFSNAHNVMMAASAAVSIPLWAIIHLTLVHPFILVGVLRNYIESGKNDTISEEDLNELDGKSGKFKKLHAKANAS